MRDKYLLDSEKLTFYIKKPTLKERFGIIVQYTLAGLILGFGIWGLSIIGLISSPRESIMQNNNDHLLANVNELTEKFDSISVFLEAVQLKDDNFYRVISKVDPLPATIRQAGFGGTDNYVGLEGFNSSSLLIDLSKKSDILLNQLKIQSESFDTIMYLVKNKEDSLLCAPAIAPIAPNDYHLISSGFGLRIHPITRKLQGHEGIDFAADIGMPIRSTGNGLVTSVDKNSPGYGMRVIINHGFGFLTLYAHMSKILVKEGELVKRGQIIGKIGNTGSSTGPHLHYEVILNGGKNNPVHYYIEDLSNEEYLEMSQQFSSSY